MGCPSRLLLGVPPDRYERQRIFYHAPVYDELVEGTSTEWFKVMNNSEPARTTLALLRNAMRESRESSQRSA